MNPTTAERVRPGSRSVAERPLLWAVGAVAVVLRVRQFAVGRSLWHDEAQLALGIREESLVDLISRPLPRNQVAPPGFLILEKLVAGVSDTDMWLRLVPFVVSLGMVGLAWWYCRGLASSAAKVAFMVVVTWSPVLIYYSSEMKQYGLDAAVAMGLLAAWADRKTHPTRFLWVGCVGVFLSHPALIVLAAVSASLFLEHRHRVGLRAAIVELRFFVLAWGAAATSAALQVRHTNDGSDIRFFWADGFAPLPTSRVHLRWWWESALGLVHLVSRLRGIASQQRVDEWTSPLVVVGLLVVVVCVVVLAVADREMLLLPLTVVGLSLLLAGFDVYPFRGRLILFLIPFVAMLVAHAIDQIDARSHPVAVVIGVLVVGQLAWSSWSVMESPDDRFDIVAALGQIEDGIAEGDVIVLGRGTRAAFDFYADDFGLGERVAGSNEDYDAEGILAAGDGASVWFVGSHVLGGDAGRVETMDRSSAIDYRWSADGVVLRRFNSRDAGASP